MHCTRCNREWVHPVDVRRDGSNLCDRCLEEEEFFIHKGAYILRTHAMPVERMVNIMQMYVRVKP